MSGRCLAMGDGVCVCWLTVIAEHPDHAFILVGDVVLRFMALPFGTPLNKVPAGPVPRQGVRFEVMDDIVAITPNDKVAGPDGRAWEDKVFPLDHLCQYRTHAGLREKSGVDWSLQKGREMMKCREWDRDVPSCVCSRVPAKEGRTGDSGKDGVLSGDARHPRWVRCRGWVLSGAFGSSDPFDVGKMGCLTN